MKEVGGSAILPVLMGTVAALFMAEFLIGVLVRARWREALTFVWLSILGAWVLAILWDVPIRDIFAEPNRRNTAIMAFCTVTYLGASLALVKAGLWLGARVRHALARSQRETSSTGH
jgi:Na+/citrate or Na+/malate symporter